MLATSREADDAVSQVRQALNELPQHHFRAATAEAGGEPHDFLTQEATGALDELFNTEFSDDARSCGAGFEFTHALGEGEMIACGENLRWMVDDPSAVANVAGDAGDATSHGFADDVGKTFAEGR